MIVGHLKLHQEIIDSIAGYNKVLVLGCGTCVTVCLTGGDKEARTLARELEHAFEFEPEHPHFDVQTIERQCEQDLVKQYLQLPDGCDAILSLACGVGVQTLAAIFDSLPVIPALNTTFLGALDEPGIWREKCHGCGDCVLADTGGICPVARCAKQLFHGPCGGSHGGKCEISQSIDCAWSLIISRLSNMQQLHRLRKITPPRDWSTQYGHGPRELVFRSAMRVGKVGNPCSGGKIDG